jgi:hypothetical protein
VQLKDTLVEVTLEPMSFAHIPFLVYYLETKVRVRSTRLELDDHLVNVVGHVFEEELRGLRLVQDVGVEDVELVPLYHLGWRILSVVMGLVVLVPFKPLLHGVEELRSDQVFVIGIVDLDEIHELLLVLGQNVLFELFVEVVTFLSVLHQFLLGLLSESDILIDVRILNFTFVFYVRISVADCINILDGKSRSEDICFWSISQSSSDITDLLFVFGNLSNNHISVLSSHFLYNALKYLT